MWLLATTAQAVQTELTSPQAGTTVYPGDEVEVTLTLTNETGDKDIVHVYFDLIVEIDGQPVVAGTAKRRMKLAPGETVGEADVTIAATAKGRKSKTEDSAAVYLVVSP